ncbi:MAG: hypothetical protein QF682_00605 [Candidatus Thermoplasmatota archaeon]|nr:hypothetical protein [Candidatus Thermoplasmatota archaeon]
MNDKKNGYRDLRPFICLVMFITGFVSFGYEVVMQAVTVVYLGSSNISMGVVISMFILGYLTSILFGSWADRLKTTKYLVLLFMAIEFFVGILIIFMGDIIKAAPAIAQWFSGLPVLGGLSYYTYLLIVVAFMAGIVPALMGGELPIAMKLLSGFSSDAYGDIGKNTGTIFALDSLGSALGGVFTAIFLLDKLGKNDTALVVGLVSLFVVLLFGILYALYRRRPVVKRQWPRISQLKTVLKERRRSIICLLVIATILSTLIVNLTPIKYGGQQEDFPGVVLYYKETPYNTIAVSEHMELDLTMYQNSKLVLSQKDHFQLYEPMVHVAMMNMQSPERVLLLGGGNGGALSEILKHSSVKEVTVVEVDPAMVKVSKDYFSTLLNSPFDDPRVNVENEMPRDYLIRYNEDISRDGIDGSDIVEKYDCIFIDLMEPRTLDRAMNYTVEFYDNVSRVLAEDGLVITHASSPVLTPETCVVIRNSMVEAFGSAQLFGTDSWSSGPYLFSLAWAGGEAPDEIKRIEHNFDNLTGQTKFYTPANHPAYWFNARTNILIKELEKTQVSTDNEPYIERLDIEKVEYW